MSALPRPEQNPASPPAAAMLQAAFKALIRTSPEVVAAMTVSIPLVGGVDVANLEKLATKAAKEHGMSVEFTFRSDNLRVRISRASDSSEEAES